MAYQFLLSPDSELRYSIGRLLFERFITIILRSQDLFLKYLLFGNWQIYLTITIINITIFSSCNLTLLKTLRILCNIFEN